MADRGRPDSARTSLKTARVTGALVGTRHALARLEPVIHGGGHERGLRSGSLNELHRRRARTLTPPLEGERAGLSCLRAPTGPLGLVLGRMRRTSASSHSPRLGRIRVRRQRRWLGLLALRTHNGIGVPDGCGPDSALRWLRALQTICRPVTCRGRAPAGRKECDLIAPLCQVAAFWRVRSASARRVR